MMMISTKALTVKPAIFTVHNFVSSFYLIILVLLILKFLLAELVSTA